MTITLELEYEEAAEYARILRLHQIWPELYRQLESECQNEAERHGVAAAGRATESGGFDDSAYRRDLIDAGRGHLLR